MKIQNEVSIGGVLVVFEMSLHVGTITSSKPTDFTKQYFETLAQVAGNHFVKQMAESMVERIQEDFTKWPNEKLWEV